LFKAIWINCSKSKKAGLEIIKSKCNGQPFVIFIVKIAYYF
jgi:hypothetical protein